MTIDWNAVANAVVAGVILGILSATSVAAKRLAAWLVRRAARHLPIDVRQGWEDDWGAEVCVSSRRRALRFGLSLWVRARTIARTVEAATIERGDEEEEAKVHIIHAGVVEAIGVRDLSPSIDGDLSWMGNNTQNVANEIARRAWDARYVQSIY